MHTESEVNDPGLVTLERELSVARDAKNIWRAFALILLVGIVLATKTRERYWPDVDSPYSKEASVAFERSDWWGLNHQTYFLYYQHPTGWGKDERKYWCAKHPDGSWKMFVWRDFDDKTYVRFPPKR